MRENLKQIGNLFFAWIKRAVDAQSALFLAAMAMLWYGVHRLSEPAGFIIIGSIIVVLSTWTVIALYSQLRNPDLRSVYEGRGVRAI